MKLLLLPAAWLSLIPVLGYAQSASYPPLNIAAVQAPTSATSRTLASTDSSSTIPFTSAAGPIIVTLPANLAVGSNTTLCQQGAGTIKVVPAAGGKLTSSLNSTAGQGLCMEVAVLSNAGGSAANWGLVDGNAMALLSPGVVTAPTLPPAPATPTTTYYVSTSGSDSNNGTSSGTAWATIAKVNGLSGASALAPNTAVAFQGGGSWTGCLAFTAGGNVSNSTTSTAGIELISYGSGSYTITSNCAGTGSGNQGPKSAVVKFDGINGVYISGGTFHAANTGTQYGILVQDSMNPTGITNVTITGNIATGANISTAATNDVAAEIAVLGYPAAASPTCSPVNQVLISGNTASGTTVTGTDDNGIFVHGCASGNSINVQNVSILNNMVTDIGGRASGIYGGGTGNGILCNGCQYVNDAYNTVTYGGANATTCGGPGGNWAYNSDNENIHNNEVDHMQPTAAVSGTCDWLAYDLDGGTTNSIIQFNHSSNDWGPGLEFYINAGGRSAWGPNTIRDNISENDDMRNRASVSYAPGYSEGAILSSASGVSPSLGYIYNNLLYNNTSDSEASCLSFDPAIPTSGAFANNICVLPGNQNPVFLNGSGAAAPSTFYFLSNDYYDIANPGTFSGPASLPGNYSSFASWQAAAPGGEAGSTLSTPAFSGTPSPTACTVTAGQGPQPCPSAYPLGSGSTLKGVGTNLLLAPYGLTLPSTDYYGNAIPNTYAGTGYNIGPYGGN